MRITPKWAQHDELFMGEPVKGTYDTMDISWDFPDRGVLTFRARMHVCLHIIAAYPTTPEGLVISIYRVTSAWHLGDSSYAYQLYLDKRAHVITPQGCLAPGLTQPPPKPLSPELVQRWGEVACNVNYL